MQLISEACASDIPVHTLDMPIIADVVETTSNIMCQTDAPSVEHKGTQFINLKSVKTTTEGKEQYDYWSDNQSINNKYLIA